MEQEILDKFDKIRQINVKMSHSTISPNKADKFGIKIAKDGVLRSSNELLTQKGVHMSKIREIWSDIPFFSSEIDEQIEINAHYRGYLKKQKADILAFFWLIILISLFFSNIIDIYISKSKNVSRETFKLLSLLYEFIISCSIKLYA